MTDKHLEAEDAVLSVIRTAMDEIDGWRGWRRMTKVALAEKAALAKQGVSQLFCGRNAPTLPTILKLCRALDLTIRFDSDGTVTIHDALGRSNPMESRHVNSVHREG